MADMRTRNLEQSGIGPILRGKVPGIYTVAWLGDSISHIGNQPATNTGQSSMFSAVLRHCVAPIAGIGFPFNTNSGILGTRIFTAVEGGTATRIEDAEDGFGAGGAYDRLAYQDVLREISSTGTVADGNGTAFQLTVDDRLFSDNGYIAPSAAAWLESTSNLLARVALYKMQNGTTARLFTGRADDSPFGANDLSGTSAGGSQSLNVTAGNEEWTELTHGIGDSSGAFTRPTVRVEIAPAGSGEYTVVGYTMIERTDLDTGIRWFMGGNGGGKIEGLLDADDPDVGAQLSITRDPEMQSYLRCMGWPRIIAIQLGANDGNNMLSSTWRDKYKRAMARLAHLYVDGGAGYQPKFLLVAPYPVLNTLSVSVVKAGEAWLLEIVKSGVSGIADYPVTIPRNDIAFISLRACLAQKPITNGVNSDGSMIRSDASGIFLVDTIHPNYKGSDVIGDRMWKAIAQSSLSPLRNRSRRSFGDSRALQ